MGKNKKKDITGVVYSTNQNYDYSYDDDSEEETLPPNQQDLRIVLDRKKGGKVVTAIIDFVGTTEDLKALGKQMKTFVQFFLILFLENFCFFCYF